MVRNSPINTAAYTSGECSFCFITDINPVIIAVIAEAKATNMNIVKTGRPEKSANIESPAGISLYNKLTESGPMKKRMT